MERIKKYSKKDFAWTRWGPEDIERAAVEIIEHKKRKCAGIKKIPPKERTFENTIYAMEAGGYGIDDAAGFIHILSNTSSDMRVRDAARKAEQKLAKAMIDLEYDEKMYEAVAQYARKSRKEKLSQDSRKLLNDILRGYKRIGFELPKKKREKLKNIHKRLAKLSNDFEKNINEYKDCILVSKKELDGLPERYIDGLKKDKSGKYKVSLDYPEFAPFMANAENAKKRKELMDKNLRKGGKCNISILKEALALRAEAARILGYRHYADFVLAERMAKNAHNAQKFLNSLAKKLEKGVQADIDAMSRAKEKKCGSKEPLYYYDISYYSNILRKKLYDIDSEKLREYFPLEHVKKEMFKIFGDLLSVRFEKTKGYPLWHKDAELYAIKERGKVLSYFILDLFPREGKFGHAAVFGIVEGRKNFTEDEYILPVGGLVMNVSSPSEKYPSLLSYGDVLTLFHEFGHLLHHCLSKARYSSQSGTSVKLDFVEAPSQMLEFWAENEKVIKRISKHYKTGKKLDARTLRNVRKSKLHLIAYSLARQISLSLFDLEIHTKNIKNPVCLLDKIILKNTGIPLPKNNIFPAGFGHLFGYDAGYYSYLWSLVIAADFFGKFKKGGLANKKIGNRYRKIILEKGSSVDEMELVRKFLGRKPDNKAFLREIGLK